MPKHVITRYSADELVQARKIAVRVRSKAKAGRDLVVELCRADSPDKDIALTFQSCSRDESLPGVPNNSMPNASLFWHGKRIRGIDWTIKHDVLRRGVPTGQFIKGWHEHYWDDGEDEDHPPIRVPNPMPRNGDASSLITWACKQWNIEGVPVAMELFND